MILADVNVLVYAFRRESPRHPQYATWLTQAVQGAEEFALHEAPLASFLRVVTNARIFERPAPAAIALDFTDRLVGAARGRWLSGSPATWARLGELVRRDAAVTGNLLPDAVLASVALSHGCRLATADRGFARYPGLAWFDPAEP